ncbi:tRNA (uracil(54)-C(5))-methyltransferase [Saliniradius amylolyticus]|uniref:tRNA/tmRNA (uracil-C(5))-methyltransferase n=1 Tax=Saliniradius amylolyticus TaxID=2183582 RepID=A0A2S2E493_9ALTE|nr:tRNA (uridine(54)-C5)-methyltransferase TrmA [Saliniradius amylolyticus]AWL12486.1 tRNA (uracil(54)-C(5))-methyltransferase [Saliniradius amylolyticus]
MRATQIDPTTYDQQLEQKAQALRTQMSAFSMPTLEVYASEPSHYRLRAEFRVWHDGDDLYHIMFDPDTKDKYRVDHFLPGSRLINSVMQELLALLRPNATARRKLYQIDYLSTLSGEILVSLIYHRPLDSEWQHAIQAILAELRKDYKIDIVGRARKQKVLLDKDYVMESQPVNGQHFQFKQVENSFTQPNGLVNSKMIQWALDASQNSRGDLLELYCGLGNFTLPLAQNFRRVLATEISRTSVKAAQYNIEANQVNNVTVLQMSSEEYTEIQASGQNHKKLKGVNLADYDCKTVLVDPPRAGLDRDTCNMVSEYQNIIYISCNPETLADNLALLTETHEVKRFALFDQFPYTHHAECGVYLQKR